MTERLEDLGRLYERLTALLDHPIFAFTPVGSLSSTDPIDLEALHYELRDFQDKLGEAWVIAKGSRLD